MKTVIYSCITGGRDEVPVVDKPSSRFDYVLFMDQAELDVVSDMGAWIGKPLVWQHPTDPVRTARWHKHQPMKCFPEHDCSIWMDANFTPTVDVSWFPDWFIQEADIACFPHPWRNSIGQEAEAIIEVEVDDERVVRDQLRRYRGQNFVDEVDNRLFETGIMVRRHSQRIKALSDMWWGEIERGSRRDQLSFTYCLWKLDMKCELLAPGHAQSPVDPFQRRGNPYFHFRQHPVRI